MMRLVRLPEAPCGSDVPFPALPAGGPIHLVAPAARVLLTQAVLPRRGRSRVLSMLPYAIEDKLAAEPERIHAALGPLQANGMHAVAAVERDWLAQWLAALARAGVRPASMKVETLLVPLEELAWTVVWRGTEGFVRTGAASGAPLESSSAAEPPRMLRRLLEEARTTGSAPQRLVVRPHAGAALPDLARWSAELNMPCEAGASWDEAHGEAGDPQIELLQGPFEPAGRARELLPRLRPALLLLIAAAVLELLGTAVHWGALRYEKAHLQAEMRTLFKTSFPHAKAIVDAPLQMRRQLDAHRSAAGEAQAGDFLVLLGRAAPLLKTLAKSVDYEQGALVVAVELSGRADAEAMQARLQQAGIAVRVLALETRGNGIEARLRLAAGGGT